MTSEAGGYQYAYTNPIPGATPGQEVPGQVPDNTVVALGAQAPVLAPFAPNVDSKYQVENDVLNPAFNPATEFEEGEQERIGPDMQDPEAPEPAGAEDQAGDNPVAEEAKGDIESDERGYGEGDVAGGGTLAGGGTEYEPVAETEPQSY